MQQYLLLKILTKQQKTIELANFTRVFSGIYDAHFECLWVCGISVREYTNTDGNVYNYRN